MSKTMIEVELDRNYRVLRNKALIQAATALSGVNASLDLDRINTAVNLANAWIRIAEVIGASTGGEDR